jgi:hypothetical protein
VFVQLFAPTAVTVYVAELDGTNATLFVTLLFHVKNPFPVAVKVTGEPEHTDTSNPALTVGIGNTVTVVDCDAFPQAFDATYVKFTTTGSFAEGKYVTVPFEIFGEIVPVPFVVVQYPPMLFTAAALNVAGAFAQTIWFPDTLTVGPVPTLTTT